MKKPLEITILFLILKDWCPLYKRQWALKLPFLALEAGF